MTDRIKRNFEEFHQRNPKVYEALVALAREAKKYRKKAGIAQLFEVLRWEWMIEGLPDEHERWKLNNNYRALYAREIMKNEPDLQNFFNTRRRRANHNTPLNNHPWS